MSSNQLCEIMVQMKALILKNPDQAKLLLASNPHFAYALLQASSILGIITPQVAQQLQGSQPINQMNLHNIPPVAPIGVVPNISLASAPVTPFFATGMGNPYQAAASAVFGSLLGGIQPRIGIQQMQNSISPDQLEVLPEDQKELLAQVMKLTPEQIEKLPPHEQQQILQLRHTMLSLNFRR
eukprot:TRINITY_DN5513_c0_g2_i8.p1 TRINITY_DN5513_c0_g2~~TRINITY_DN5513_c0_g2_i8.p1  ORF type:complete len:205 (+),score=57.16 TRINITY_DN5513_c0_g2_i8:72-617(+)